MSKPKKESRAKRWARLSAEAVGVVEELVEMYGEFESWQENLPDNLQQSALGEKLQTICDLDLQGALDTLQEAADAEVPLGFGRD